MIQIHALIKCEALKYYNASGFDGVKLLMNGFHFASLSVNEPKCHLCNLYEKFEKCNLKNPECYWKGYF